MKKFLSLVLALVMTMSLVTVSAGAKDFADDSSITYKEAVDVISGIGIVDGYSDGSFGPDGALTRGAAAKIICNLILGPTTASALSASTAPFKDVPTTMSILDISRSSAYILIKKNFFRSFKIGKQLRISKASFDEWLDRG